MTSPGDPDATATPGSSSGWTRPEPQPVTQRPWGEAKSDSANRMDKPADDDLVVRLPRGRHRAEFFGTNEARLGYPASKPLDHLREVRHRGQAAQVVQALQDGGERSVAVLEFALEHHQPACAVQPDEVRTLQLLLVAPLVRPLVPE